MWFVIVLPSFAYFMTSWIWHENQSSPSVCVDSLAARCTNSSSSERGGKIPRCADVNDEKKHDRWRGIWSSAPASLRRPVNAVAWPPFCCWSVCHCPCAARSLGRKWRQLAVRTSPKSIVNRYAVGMSPAAPADMPRFLLFAGRGRSRPSPRVCFLPDYTQLPHCACTLDRSARDVIGF